MKITKRIIPLICCIVLFATGCTPTSSEKLSDYPTVTAHFSEQETADLQTLLNLFEHEIGIRSNAPAKAKADGYIAFNKKLVDFMMLEEPKDSFLLPLQTRMKLLDALRIGTFRSIWITGASTPRDTCDCSVASNLARDNKFVDFLADMGEEFTQLSELHTDIRMAGAMSPTYAAAVFQHFGRLDAEDPRIQLVYVLSCLSWGMQWEN